MCLPLVAAIPIALAVASTAATAAGAVMQNSAQKAQAQSQANYETQLAEQQNKQFAQQSNQGRIQQGQEDLARAQQIQNIHQQSAAAIATAATAAGEGGVSGISVNNLLADYHSQELGYTARVNEQGAISNASYEAQQTSLREGTNYNKLATLSPVSSPSFAGAALRIGGGALDAFSTYASTKQGNAMIYGSDPKK